MGSSSQLIINDTNIWIDLKCIGLLKEVFLLPYTIGVPDILYAEELEEIDGVDLKNYGIVIIKMTESEILETAIRSSKINRVSFNDLTTLVLAKSRNCILVTGDGNLRKEARKDHIDLKDTIWLIDEMVGNNVITKIKAVDICKKLIKEGRRLPKEELEKRIVIWDDEVAVDISVE